MWGKRGTKVHVHCSWSAFNCVIECHSENFATYVYEVGEFGEFGILNVVVDICMEEIVVHMMMVTILIAQYIDLQWQKVRHPQYHKKSECYIYMCIYNSSVCGPDEYQSRW